MFARIYHNPACSNSRGALALLRQHGVEPEIVEYLKTPPDRQALEAVLVDLGLTPRLLLRRKEPDYVSLGLDDPTIPDDRLLDAMLAYPILIERPIVITARGARICRPPERVLDLIPPPHDLRSASSTPSEPDMPRMG